MLKNILEVWEFILQEAIKTKVKLRSLREGNCGIKESSTKCLKYIKSKEENDMENHRDIIKLKESYQKLMNKFVNPRLDLKTLSINSLDTFNDTENINIKNSRKIDLIFNRKSPEFAPILPGKVRGTLKTKVLLGWTGQPLSYQSFKPRPELSMKPTNTASAFFIFPELIVESKKESVCKKYCSGILNMYRKKGKKRRRKYRTPAYSKPKQLVQEIPKSHLSKFYNFNPLLLQFNDKIENHHDNKSNCIANTSHYNNTETKGNSKIDNNITIGTSKHNKLDPAINSEASLSKITDEAVCEAHIHEENIFKLTSNGLMSSIKSESTNNLLSKAKIEQNDNITFEEHQINKNEENKTTKQSQDLPSRSLTFTHLTTEIHNKSDSTNKSHFGTNNISKLNTSNNNKGSLLHLSLKDSSVAHPVELNSLKETPIQLRSSFSKDKAINQAHNFTNISIQKKHSNYNIEKTICLPHSNATSSIQNKSVIGENLQQKNDNFKHLNPEIISTDNISKHVNEDHKSKSTFKELHSNRNIKGKHNNFNLGSIAKDNTTLNANSNKSSIMHKEYYIDSIDVLKSSFTDKGKEMLHKKHFIGTPVPSEPLSKQINNEANIFKPATPSKSLDRNHDIIHRHKLKMDSTKVKLNTYLNDQLNNKSINCSQHHCNGECSPKRTTSGNESIIKERNKGVQPLQQLTKKSPLLNMDTALDLVKPKSSLKTIKNQEQQLRSNIKSGTLQNNSIKFLKQKEFYFNTYLNKLPQKSKITNNRYELMDFNSRCQDYIKNNDKDNRMCSQTKKYNTQKALNHKNTLHYKNINISDNYLNKMSKADITSCQNTGNYSLSQKSKNNHDNKQIDCLNHNQETQLNKINKNYSDLPYSDHLLEKISHRINTDFRTSVKKHGSRGQLEEIATHTLNNQSKSLPYNGATVEDSKANDIIITRNKLDNTGKCIYNGNRRKLHKKKVSLKVFNLKMYGSGRSEIGRVSSDDFENVSKSQNINQYKKLDHTHHSSSILEHSVLQTNKRQGLASNNTLFQTRILTRNLSYNHLLSMIMNVTSIRNATTLANYISNYTYNINGEYSGTNQLSKLETTGNINSKAKEECIKSKGLNEIKYTVTNNQDNKCDNLNFNNGDDIKDLKIHSSNMAKSTANNKLTESDNDKKVQPIIYEKPYCLNARKNHLLTNNKGPNSSREENDYTTSKQNFSPTNLIMNKKKIDENPKINEIYSKNVSEKYTNSQNKCYITRCNKNLLCDTNLKIKDLDYVTPYNFSHDSKINLTASTNNLLNTSEINTTKDKNVPSETTTIVTINKLDNNINDYYNDQILSSLIISDIPKRDRWKSKTHRLKDWVLLKKKYEHSMSHRRTLIKGKPNQGDTTVATPHCTNSNHLPEKCMFNGNINHIQKFNDNAGKCHEIIKNECNNEQNKMSPNVNSIPKEDIKMNNFTGITMTGYHDDQINHVTNKTTLLRKNKHNQNVKHIIKQEPVKALSTTAFESVLVKKNTDSINSNFSSLTPIKNIMNKSVNKIMVNSKENIRETNSKGPVKDPVKSPRIYNPIFSLSNGQSNLENVLNNNNYQLNNPKLARATISIKGQPYIKNDHKAGLSGVDNNGKTITEIHSTRKKISLDLTVDIPTSTASKMVDKTLDDMIHQQFRKSKGLETHKNQLNQNRVNSLQANMFTKIKELKKSVISPLKSRDSDMSICGETTINLKEKRILNDGVYKSLTPFRSQGNMLLTITEKNHKKNNSKISHPNDDNGFGSRMINDVHNQSSTKMNNTVPFYNQNKYQQCLFNTGKTLSYNYRENAVNNLLCLENGNVFKMMNNNETHKIKPLQHLEISKKKISKTTSLAKGISVPAKNQLKQSSVTSIRESLNNNIDRCINISRSPPNERLLNIIKLTKNATHGNTFQNAKTQKDSTCEQSKIKEKTNNFKDHVAKSILFSQSQTHKLKTSDNKLKSVADTKNIAIKDKKSFKSSKKLNNYINSNEEFSHIIHPIEKEVHAIKIPLNNKLPS